MKFNIIANKHEKLKNTLKDKLLHRVVGDSEIDKIIDLFEQYESENLQTIEKLTRNKTVEVRKISGALKQTINVHGPITKVLIGSATKRIYGALLEPKVKLGFWQSILKWFKL